MTAVSAGAASKDPQSGAEHRGELETAASQAPYHRDPCIAVGGIRRAVGRVTCHLKAGNTDEVFCLGFVTYSLHTSYSSLTISRTINRLIADSEQFSRPASASPMMSPTEWQNKSFEMEGREMERVLLGLMVVSSMQLAPDVHADRQQLHA